MMGWSAFLFRGGALANQVCTFSAILHRVNAIFKEGKTPGVYVEFTLNAMNTTEPLSAAR